MNTGLGWGVGYAVPGRRLVDFCLPGKDDGVAKSPIYCVVAGSANARRTLCTPARGRNHHASESHSVRLPVYRTFVLSHRRRIFMFLRVQQG